MIVLTQTKVLDWEHSITKFQSSEIALDCWAIVSLVKNGIMGMTKRIATGQNGSGSRHKTSSLQ